MVEAGWAVEDILNGSTKCDTTDKMLANNEDNMEMMFEDKKLQSILHKPSGEHLHQGSLIRGDGLWQAKCGCFDYGFKRFTSQKLEKMEAKNQKFMIERGCFPPFLQTWVFKSHNHVVFDETKMGQFLHLTFAKDLEEASRHYPKVNGFLTAMV